MFLHVNHSFSMSNIILHFRSSKRHILSLKFIYLCNRLSNEICLQSQLRLYSSSHSILSPSNVLSKSNKEKCIKLLNSQKPYDVNLNENIKKAAVLVPICEVDNKLSLLYIVRAIHLKNNGGEVAFPGGMLDESDESLEATALRETFEEVGISSTEVDVWCKGPEINRRDVRVTPVLGYVGSINLDKLKINTSEVFTAFPVSLEHLSSVTNFRTTKFRFGKTFIYTTPVYLVGVKRIWGLTAYITHIILNSLIAEHYQKNITFKATLEKVLQTKKKR